MKRLAVLGSTGSIGLQTLDVVRQHPDRLQIVGLAAGSNGELLRSQMAEFGVRRGALFAQTQADQFDLPHGINAIRDLACADDVDCVVVSVAGVIGLIPTVAAIQAGKNIALASKEVLVAAGEVVMPLVADAGITMTPIDSEHSAIFQCLEGTKLDQVKKIILTASGGPFRGKTTADLRAITVEQALNHPTWRMGGKITIDSATLMNKGLEMIEARWLFGLEMDQVDAVIHPQSIIHSMVEFNDGSVLGQLGWPNMRLPIQYALLYPDRVPNQLPPWNPIETPNLTFEPIDVQTFRSMGLAREAARIGGTMPAVFNAANEWAANAFLAGRCGFLEIFDVVEGVMASHEVTGCDLESILEVDQWARTRAESVSSKQVTDL
ncbi:MAG: 1-deoxy-D-xylulose-5-phosphate reductoisomerase [Armatimonadetes bacterium]|nr:1-deoxy-D-xylulose-5-phosphate reductoisomerase [Armatimonadota bacterium]